MSFLKDLSNVGSNPSVRVLILLHEGSLRFNDLLENDTPDAERALSASLRDLDRAGLVARRVEAGPPLQVLYGLTDAGSRLSPTLEALTAWLEAGNSTQSARAHRASL